MLAIIGFQDNGIAKLKAGNLLIAKRGREPEIKVGENLELWTKYQLTNSLYVQIRNTLKLGLHVAIYLPKSDQWLHMTRLSKDRSYFFVINEDSIDLRVLEPIVVWSNNGRPYIAKGTLLSPEGKILNGGDSLEFNVLYETVAGGDLIVKEERYINDKRECREVVAYLYRHDGEEVLRKPLSQSSNRKYHIPGKTWNKAFRLVDWSYKERQEARLTEVANVESDSK